MANSRDRRRPLTQGELEEIAENIFDSDGDLSDAETIFSDHNTNSDFSEESGSDSDNQNLLSEDTNASCESDDPSRFYYGKNRRKWSKQPPASSRTRATNIVSHLPGLSGPARVNKPKTTFDAFNLLLDSTIIDQIIEKTNEKITDLQTNYGDRSLDCQFLNHVDKTEMMAFLGLLYLAGAFKSSNEDINSLFATDGTGRDIFRSVMTAKRFSFLLAALRFDDPTTRNQRIAEGDQLAAISEVFGRFVTNCHSNYSCGEYVTVDEMLVGFRGHCRFRMYIKSKPVKYGLKIMCLCDARTHYLVNAFVYAGKQNNIPNPRKLAIPTLNVLSLIQPIANTNRNVTGDNWFSSLQLVEELSRHKLTYVGTMRQNKREIPQQFLPNKERPVYSSLFGFTKDITLVSYVPKKNRSVCLISSLHHNNAILDGTQMLPDIIDFYNITKVGVDVLDQTCANYKVGRRTRRWPQAIWFRMMDITGVNSRIIFNAANPNNELTHQKFIINLGRELIKNQLVRRAQMENIPRQLRQIIRQVGNITENVPHRPPARPPKRARCYICPRNDNKQSLICNQCSKHICRDHCITKQLCTNCTE